MEHKIFFWICLLLIAKNITIGSDFSFWYWIKYGRKYIGWYFDRKSFKDYLNHKKEKETPNTGSCKYD